MSLLRETFASGRRLAGPVADEANAAAVRAARPGRLPDFAAAQAAAAAKSTAQLEGLAVFQISILSLDARAGTFVGYRRVVADVGGINVGTTVKRLLGVAEPAPGGAVRLTATSDQDVGIWQMLVRGNEMLVGEEIGDGEAPPPAWRVRARLRASNNSHGTTARPAPPRSARGGRGEVGPRREGGASKTR